MARDKSNYRRKIVQEHQLRQESYQANKTVLDRASTEEQQEMLVTDSALMRSGRSGGVSFATLYTTALFFIYFLILNLRFDDLFNFVRLSLKRTMFYTNYSFSLNYQAALDFCSEFIKSYPTC